MAKVRVVTDSGARFDDPNYAEDNRVEVVPLKVHFRKTVYRDGIDIDSAEMFQRIKQYPDLPRVTAPGQAEFEAVFQKVGRETDQIIVVTNSKHFTKAFNQAQKARSTLLGRWDIVIFDSGTTSAAQGYLVEQLVKAANQGMQIEKMVKFARDVVSRLYSVFYVETLDYIERHGLLERTQSILGDMLEIKPLITMEDGELITMEKARTHSQAIDKVVEFVAEFSDIDKLCILQSTLRIVDRTRMLQDRLALELGRTQHPVLLYEPLLTSMIGPDAIGVALLDGE